MNKAERQPAAPVPKLLRYSFRTLTLLAMVVTSIIAWIAKRDHRNWERAEALQTINKMGGLVNYEPPLGPKEVGDRDATEIDLRNSQVTNAELKYVITLNPQRRLRLGSSMVTEEGVQKLQQALPNCKIER